MSRARLRSVRDLPTAGRRVFLRADLNVPLRDGRVADDARIRASLETLEYLRAGGARVVVASHLGRPGGKRRPELSLGPLAQALDLPLASDCVGPEVEERVARLAEGEALLLENLRFHPGEEENAPDFAAALARLCDVYVNDAFGTAHRAHASTAGIVGRVADSAAGLLLEREIEVLSRLRDAPTRPYVCIIGGAKISDKLAVLETLATRADALIVGGAMAYTFLLARGEPVGSSLVEPERIDAARRLLAGSAELLLPSDHVVARGADDAAGAETVTRIPDDRMGLDVGPATTAAIRKCLEGAQTVFWNGPLGRFEFPPFDAGTRALALTLAASSAYCVVGGGDSLAAVHACGVADRVDHLSTGGGAALELLEGRALPGVEVLRESP